MLPLAHLGIGAGIVRPLKLPVKAVLLGTLLPDLIDKPLYYIPYFATGRWGAELGLISGTRSLGHTLLFLGALFLIAVIPGARRLWWLGLAMGAATHLLLDNFLEPFTELTVYSGRLALLFPLYGWKFPLAIHHTPGEHLLSHFGMFEMAGELVGAWLLWKMWKKRASRT